VNESDSTNTAATVAAAAYEALTEKVALLDDADRAVVAVTGDRAPDMLNGLVTNAVGPVGEGRCVYAFMLTPKGRPLAELRMVPCPAAAGEPAIWAGDVWLDTPAACADALLAHLTRYMPPLYARFARVAVGRVGLVGPLATAALEQSIEEAGWTLSGPAPAALEELQASLIRTPNPESVAADPEHHAPIVLVRRESLEGPGFDLYVPDSALPAIRATLAKSVRSLGGVPADRDTWDILRVERGVPVYGREITLDHLPHETSQTERAIHFEKGCYTGQEVVARIHYRGHVNRHLRGFVSMDPATPFEPGSGLFSEEREVGQTGTTVVSPRFGPIALGYARRDVKRWSRSGDRPESLGCCVYDRPLFSPSTGLQRRRRQT
jgi:folate-binding protein YgfZ